MKVIIIILQAILNLARKRRDLIANRSKIPPEYRDDVVVWYSPKKQRLTNYDVIESYAEDFTTWSLDNENGIAAVTENEIHITESIIYYRSVVRQDKVRETQSFKVLVSGLTDNQAVQYIYNDGTNYVTLKLTTNGVHELPVSIKQRNGFNVEPAGICDVIIKELPTSILKDFSGNGLDAYMYGFQGKITQLDNQIQQLTAAKSQIQSQLGNPNQNMQPVRPAQPQQAVQQVNLWDEIDKEVCSLNNDQQAILAKDDVYNNVSAELQMLIQQELINSVRDKVANSPRGKELLEKQLNNIRAKKDSIIEEANKELELFKKFQIAAQANPKLTYVDFCNNIKNKEV